MQTEARGVHWEATAALLHHLSQNVHLDLVSEEENRLRAADPVCPLPMSTQDDRSNSWPWCWGTATWRRPACSESSGVIGGGDSVGEVVGQFLRLYHALLQELPI